MRYWDTSALVPLLVAEATSEVVRSWLGEVLAVRSRATSVLARHPLRAADAAQLGAALHVQDQLGAPLQFVCLDQRLTEAAECQGLAIVSG